MHYTPVNASWLNMAEIEHRSLPANVWSGGLIPRNASSKEVLTSGSKGGDRQAAHRSLTRITPNWRCQVSTLLPKTGRQPDRLNRRLYPIMTSFTEQ
ncbi:MAG: hypothetical protein R3E79_21335 [Caldilineaceae bacterium]